MAGLQPAVIQGLVIHQASAIMIPIWKDLWESINQFHFIIIVEYDR